MPAVEHFNINHQLLDTETLICHQILYKVNVALNLNLELQLINIYRRQSDIETPIYIMEWLISCLSSQGAYSKSRFLNCVRKFRPIMSKLAKAIDQSESAILRPMQMKLNLMIKLLVRPPKKLSFFHI